MRVLFIFFALLFSNACSSQTKIFIGAGVNQSSFATGTVTQRTTDKTTTSGQTSWLATTHIEKKLSSSYAAFAGLDFYAAKARVRRTDFSSTDERDITINYLMIPIGVSGKIFSTKTGGGFIAFGAYASYALSGREKGTYSFATNSTSVIYNNIQIRSSNPNQISPTVVNPFDLGALVEAGLNIHKFRISARYLRGLSTVMTNPDLYSSRYYSQSLALVLNYQCFSF